MVCYCVLQWADRSSCWSGCQGDPTRATLERLLTAAGSSVVLRQFYLTLRLMQHSQHATDFRVTCCHRRPLEETLAGNWLLHSLPAVPKAQRVVHSWIRGHAAVLFQAEQSQAQGQRAEGITQGSAVERSWDRAPLKPNPSPCVAGPFSWCTGGTPLVSGRFRKQPTCLINSLPRMCSDLFTT